MPMDIDEDKIDQAVLALLSLGRHDGEKTWKGFDWEVMSRLHRKAYIPDTAGKAKSVLFTEQGLQESGRSPWVLAFWLYKTAQKVVLMSIQGTRKRGPFDDGDANRIGPLIPHIRRVLEIKDRLELADVRSSNLARTLPSLSFGVLLLDKAGCVLEANSYAETLISAGCGLPRGLSSIAG